MLAQARNPILLAFSTSMRTLVRVAGSGPLLMQGPCAGAGAAKQDDSPQKLLDGDIQGGDRKPEAGCTHEPEDAQGLLCNMLLSEVEPACSDADVPLLSSPYTAALSTAMRSCVAPARVIQTLAYLKH